MDALRFLTTLAVDAGDVTTYTAPELPGLKLWLDASDASTVTVVTGVSQWTDKSGTGNTVVQATEVNQPTYSAAVQNGLNAILFDTSTWYLVKTSPTGLTSLAAMTVFMVSTAAGTGSTRQAVGVWEASNLCWRIAKVANQLGRQIEVSAAGSVAVTVNANAGTQDVFYVTTATVDPTTTAINHAGTDATGSTPGTLFASASPLYVGASVGPTALWNGYIGEILVYNRKLSATEISEVQTYLNDKWDL